MRSLQPYWFFALPLMAVLTAVPVNAQTYYDGYSIYSEPLPPPSGQDGFDHAPYATGSVPQYPHSRRYIRTYEDDEMDGPASLSDPEAPPFYSREFEPGPRV